MLSVSNEIEHIVPPSKFLGPKCSAYKGTKDLVAHIAHFKMATDPICMLMEKREAKFFKVFASNL